MQVGNSMGGFSFVWAKMHGFFYIYVSIFLFCFLRWTPSAVLFKTADAVVVDVMLFH